MWDACRRWFGGGAARAPAGRAFGASDVHINVDRDRRLDQSRVGGLHHAGPSREREGRCRRGPDRARYARRTGQLHQDIIKAMLNAKVPVIVYVTPRGRLGRLGGHVHHDRRARRRHDTGQLDRRGLIRERRPAAGGGASRARTEGRRAITPWRRPRTCSRPTWSRSRSSANRNVEWAVDAVRELGRGDRRGGARARRDRPDRRAIARSCSRPSRGARSSSRRDPVSCSSWRAPRSSHSR